MWPFTQATYKQWIRKVIICWASLFFRVQQIKYFTGKLGARGVLDRTIFQLACYIHKCISPSLWHSLITSVGLGKQTEILQGHEIFAFRDDNLAVAMTNFFGFLL
jgi:hypothetical protein